MSHIPYGYRIEGGKAVPDEEQVEKLNAFFDFYLKGYSLKTARHLAGVELTVPCIRGYMKSGIFAGTDYYPPIVPDDLLDKIAEEREHRTHPGTSVITPPVPVFEEFRIRTADKEKKGTAAEIAAWRYSLIEVVKDTDRHEEARRR